MPARANATTTTAVTDAAGRRGDDRSGVVVVNGRRRPPMASGAKAVQATADTHNRRRPAPVAAATLGRDKSRHHAAWPEFKRVSAETYVGASNSPTTPQTTIYLQIPQERHAAIMNHNRTYVPQSPRSDSIRTAVFRVNGPATSPSVEMAAANVKATPFPGTYRLQPSPNDPSDEDIKRKWGVERGAPRRISTISARKRATATAGPAAVPATARPPVVYEDDEDWTDVIVQQKPPAAAQPQQQRSMLPASERNKIVPTNFEIVEESEGTESSSEYGYIPTLTRNPKPSTPDSVTRLPPPILNASPPLTAPPLTSLPLPPALQRSLQPPVYGARSTPRRRATSFASTVSTIDEFAPRRPPSSLAISLASNIAPRSRIQNSRLLETIDDALASLSVATDMTIKSIKRSSPEPVVSEKQEIESSTIHFANSAANASDWVDVVDTFDVTYEAGGSRSASPAGSVEGSVRIVLIEGEEFVRGGGGLRKRSSSFLMSSATGRRLSSSLARRRSSIRLSGAWSNVALAGSSSATTSQWGAGFLVPERQTSLALFAEMTDSSAASSQASTNASNFTTVTLPNPTPVQKAKSILIPGSVSLATLTPPPSQKSHDPTLPASPTRTNPTPRDASRAILAAANAGHVATSGYEKSIPASPSRTVAADTFITPARDSSLVMLDAAKPPEVMRPSLDDSAMAAEARRPSFENPAAKAAPVTLTQMASTSKTATVMAPTRESSLVIMTSTPPQSPRQEPRTLASASQVAKFNAETLVPESPSTPVTPTVSIPSRNSSRTALASLPIPAVVAPASPVSQGQPAESVVEQSPPSPVALKQLPAVVKTRSANDAPSRSPLATSYGPDGTIERNGKPVLRNWEDRFGADDAPPLPSATPPHMPEYEQAGIPEHESAQTPATPILDLPLQLQTAMPSQPEEPSSIEEPPTPPTGDIDPTPTMKRMKNKKSLAALIAKAADASSPPSDTVSPVVSMSPNPLKSIFSGWFGSGAGKNEKKPAIGDDPSAHQQVDGVIAPLSQAGTETDFDKVTGDSPDDGTSNAKKTTEALSPDAVPAEATTQEQMTSSATSLIAADGSATTSILTVGAPITVAKTSVDTNSANYPHKPAVPLSSSLDASTLATPSEKPAAERKEIMITSQAEPDSAVEVTKTETNPTSNDALGGLAMDPSTEDDDLPPPLPPKDDVVFVPALLAESDNPPDDLVTVEIIESSPPAKIGKMFGGRLKGIFKF